MNTELSRRLFLTLLGAVGASAAVPLVRGVEVVEAAPAVEIVPPKVMRPGVVQAWLGDDKGGWREIGNVTGIEDSFDEVVFQSFDGPIKRKGARETSLQVDVEDRELAAILQNSNDPVPVRVFVSDESPQPSSWSPSPPTWFAMDAALAVSLKHHVRADERVRTEMVMVACGPVRMSVCAEPPDLEHGKGPPSC